MTKILKMETTMSKQSKSWFSGKTKRTIVDIIIYLYVLLFLYAATSKLIEYDKFQLQISKSPIITDFAYILVWMVPALEIIISIMLLIKKTLMLGLYAAFGLMCLFTAYIYAILNFTDTIPCSCGGVLEKLGWTEHLIFNIGFVVLAFLGILLQTTIEKKTL
ncbi:Methylamine utilisation protein MauE [Pedobacter sp. ok626]|uniref:MauE/DoxX family redox-associated membrane protein n=1 Tax=Pedobacter sp. ok626 TaxID=1761882 RepID=UPI0008820825|nr:MauE/DoxX family redox-associated membrane protein [Pedobacter sp. ok626]SDK10447.1 Methylamine utilisation protein MauE [Pedobacter sp. ok626]